MTDTAPKTLRDEFAMADAEVERMMSLTDEEVIAECRAAGEDPESVANEVRELVVLAILARSNHIEAEGA